MSGAAPDGTLSTGAVITMIMVRELAMKDTASEWRSKSLKCTDLESVKLDPCLHPRMNTRTFNFLLRHERVKDALYMCKCHV